MKLKPQEFILTDERATALGIPEKKYELFDMTNVDDDEDDDEDDDDGGDKDDEKKMKKRNPQTKNVYLKLFGPTLPSLTERPYAVRLIYRVHPDPMTKLIGQQAIGAWGTGGGDRCDLWYDTGKTGRFYYDQTNLVMNTVTDKAKQHKYAMEVNAPGWFHAPNPFGANRTLYLSFLVSDKEGTYQTAEIMVDDEEMHIACGSYSDGSQGNDSYYTIGTAITGSQ